MIGCFLLLATIIALSVYSLRGRLHFLEIARGLMCAIIAVIINVFLLLHGFCVGALTAVTVQFVMVIVGIIVGEAHDRPRF